MNRQHVLALCAIATLTFTGTAPAAALQNPGDPVEFDVQGGRIRVVTVADGLVHPWSISFLPDGGMLVVESPGRLRMIRNGTLDPEPVWTSSSDDGGSQLKAVAVHPGFSENRLVYFSYPKRDAEGRSTLAVARGRLDGRTLTEVGDIFVAEAWETGGNIAGRIFFGPDRMLFVAIGDRDRLCCIGREDPSLRIKAQYLGNHIGKVLRIRDDGGVPADNPFVDVPHALPEIFTYGHRNTYGFTIHPETGDLWQAEIGPMGGDEVNILAPGGNYGWPLVSMGRNYSGSLVSLQPWEREGMVNPRIFWVPSISPSSIAFYTGDQFPDWQGSLLVGALNGRQLQRVSFNQPSQAERRETLLGELGIRVRDVQQGPDGNVYVATEISSGGSDPTGTVLRIEPAN